MELTLNVVNGYWCLNEKQLKSCSIAKKNLFDTFLRMKLVKSNLPEVSTFNKNPKKVKELFNYKFKTNLNNFPNVNDLTFERK
jgi:hypothetical protein